MLRSDILDISLNHPIHLARTYLPLIIFFNILYCTSLIASENPSSDSTKKQPDLTLLAFFQQGMVMPTNTFVRGNNLKQMPINSFRAISLQLLKQTYGKELWEQLYNYPRYGIGIYSSQVMHTSELGDPIALYGIISVPQIKRKNFSLYTDIGAGIAINWETYFEDKYNIAIGGEMTAYAYAGFYLEYYLCHGLFLDAGISINHYSNGALRMPNLGINMFAPKISLGYNFTKAKREFDYRVIPAYVKRSEYVFSFFTGWANELYYGNDVDSVTKYKGVYYPSYGLSLTYNRQISYKSKFGIGVMVDYLGSACTDITVENNKLEGNNASFREGLELSIFPSYELVINSFSVIIQPGFFLYRTKYPWMAPSTYQRIGLKYNVHKDISLGITMRAHRFSIADYIEWTIGYRLHL